MEVKINKEIRDYTEAIFFGLSLRQFIFSGLACGIAVGLYFLLHPYMSMETVSWICVLGAAPCVVFGFVKYHGMTAEQFIWAWIKSEILMPKKRVIGQNVLMANPSHQTFYPHYVSRSKQLHHPRLKDSFPIDSSHSFADK